MRFCLDRSVTLCGILAVAVLWATPAAATTFQNPINVDTLPEGVAPRNNEFTDRATLALGKGDLKLAEDGPGAGDEDYSVALQYATDGLASDPGNPQGLFQAARAHLGLRNFVAADSLFSEAVQLHPRYVVEVDHFRQNAWIDAYNLGLEADRLGNTQNAIDNWERAGVIYLKRPEALLNLGGLVADEYPDQALEHYRNALEILTDPGNRAAQDEETIADWDNDEPVARMNLAILFLQRDDWQSARPQLEDLLRTDPENMDALSYLSLALQRLGLADSAAVVSTKMMSTEGVGPLDLFQMGATLFNSQDYPQAAIAFGRVIQAVPQHLDATYYYALSLFSAEDWAALGPAADQLRQLNPNGIQWARFGVAALNGMDENTAPVTDALEELTFLVDKLTFSAVPEGATVGGVVIGTSIPAGTTVELRFYFYAESGEELGSETVSIQSGEPETNEPGEEVQFGVQISSNTQVIGYRYEVVGG